MADADSIFGTVDELVAQRLAAKRAAAAAAAGDGDGDGDGDKNTAVFTSADTSNDGNNAAYEEDSRGGVVHAVADATHNNAARAAARNIIDESDDDEDWGAPAPAAAAATKAPPSPAKASVHTAPARDTSSGAGDDGNASAAQIADEANAAAPTASSTTAAAAAAATTATTTAGGARRTGAAAPARKAKAPRAVTLAPSSSDKRAQRHRADNNPYEHEDEVESLFSGVSDAATPAAATSSGGAAAAAAAATAAPAKRAQQKAPRASASAKSAQNAVSKPAYVVVKPPPTTRSPPPKASTGSGSGGAAAHGAFTQATASGTRVTPDGRVVFTTKDEAMQIPNTTKMPQTLADMEAVFEHIDIEGERRHVPHVRTGSSGDGDGDGDGGSGGQMKTKGTKSGRQMPSKPIIKQGQGEVYSKAKRLGFLCELVEMPGAAWQVEIVEREIRAPYNPLQKHTVYKTTTRLFGWCVERRYKDFCWLRDYLRAVYPGVPIRRLPQKQFFGRFESKFLEERQELLERWTNVVAANSRLRSSEGLRCFLEKRGDKDFEALKKDLMGSAPRIDPTVLTGDVVVPVDADAQLERARAYMSLISTYMEAIEQLSHKMHERRMQDADDMSKIGTMFSGLLSCGEAGAPCWTNNCDPCFMLDEKSRILGDECAAIGGVLERGYNTSHHALVNVVRDEREEMEALTELIEARAALVEQYAAASSKLADAKSKHVATTQSAGSSSSAARQLSETIEADSLQAKKLQFELEYVTLCALRCVDEFHARKAKVFGRIMRRFAGASGAAAQRLRDSWAAIALAIQM